MDCNNYSYTAPGFGVDETAPILEYHNDDMRALFDYWRNQYDATPNHPRHNDYIVSAWSYDGQLEVDEVFTHAEPARKLYTHIITNYSHTPPTKRALNAAIRQAHKQDRTEGV